MVWLVLGGHQEEFAAIPELRDSEPQLCLGDPAGPAGGLGSGRMGATAGSQPGGEPLVRSHDAKGGGMEV